jgi:hypothetical protein
MDKDCINMFTMYAAMHCYCFVVSLSSSAVTVILLLLLFLSSCGFSLCM